MVLLLCLVATATGLAQQAGQAAMPTPVPTPQPIAASDIPARASEAAKFIRQVVVDTAPDARLEEIQKNLPDQQNQISKFREKTEEQLHRPGPVSIISENRNAWERVHNRLEHWLEELSTRSSTLDDTLKALRGRAALWQLTQDQETGASLPEALAEQIVETLTNFHDAERTVRAARDTILELQATVAQEKSGVEAVLAQHRREITKRTRGVFVIDSEPLWKVFANDTDGGNTLAQANAVRNEQWQSLLSYVSEQGQSLLSWVLMWLALIVLMVVMRRQAKKWVEQDTSLRTAVTLFSRPFSTALVVTALLNVVLYPKAPAVWSDAVGLIIILAMSRLLPGLLPKSLRPVPYSLVLIFVPWRLVELVPEESVVYRLGLIGLAVVGIAASSWLIRTLKTAPGILPQPWHQRAIFSSCGALGLFAGGAVTNIFGGVVSSAIVLKGTTYAMVSVVIWWLVGATLRSIVRGGLLTDSAHRWGIAPDHSDTVRTTLFNIITFGSVVGWLGFSLRAFYLLNPLIDTVRQAFDWQITIGAFSVSPGNFLVFGFVIWLSFKIADLVQFTLKAQLMPKADLPRGVPEATSLLMRYLVIAVGAVAAAAAAGLDISKITIIFGALGVGVGFGLQNIVNNFVSGLILLFERPIRVGDSLALDNTGCVVTKIGLRASIVRTWDGANIIVPNANLISKNVTNWTLDNDRRRVEIPINIAFGADPSEAARVIVGVANDNKAVDDWPEPTCFFSGFGSSALEFKLYAWTAATSVLSVASDLRFAVAEKLKDAGIEIPFPQLDLHMSNPDPTFASLAGMQTEIPARDDENGTRVPEAPNG